MILNSSHLYNNKGYRERTVNKNELEKYKATKITTSKTTIKINAAHD